VYKLSAAAPEIYENYGENYIDTLMPTDEIFDCSCGNIMDRDVNAARNIVARGFC
jgi:transposase